jgi:NAD(P)-dependent dehydrogenase (short-subunit alcohol dehydrogenase family)
VQRFKRHGIAPLWEHAAPKLRVQGSGSIVNIGSVAGHRAGYSSSVIYGIAKAAVIHLTRCAAMELGEDGVRVNSISPGGIATGIFAKSMGITAAEADGMAERVN